MLPRVAFEYGTDLVGLFDQLLGRGVVELRHVHVELDGQPEPAIGLGADADARRDLRARRHSGRCAGRPP